MIVAVTGSVAAYKSVEVVRRLLKHGLTVQVVMSRSARRFVGEATFSAITGRPVYADAFQVSSGELHVDLAANAEHLLIAPCAADTLARLAHGRADDLISATALCMPKRISVAPAMHPTMWAHPATRRNVERLIRDGVRFIGPVEGVVASGDVGWGRMSEPEQIVETWLGARDLAGRRLVISAGPTVEDLDPVRFISNRSSGKMGFALAERAAARGAEVDLVAGPVNLPTPPRVRRHDVRSALELLEGLRERLWRSAPPPDALLMAAAVGDFRAAAPGSTKHKRQGDYRPLLVENPDIIKTLASERQGNSPTLIAFAVETGDDAELLAAARQKLQDKAVDMVVANLGHEAFGSDTNRVYLVDAEHAVALPTLDKHQVADAILDWLRKRWTR